MLEPEQQLQTVIFERQNEYEELKSAIEQVGRGEYDVLDMEDIKQRGRERFSQIK